jgi:hypothetical protein
VIEQKINEFIGDAESTCFGTGWWSGIFMATPRGDIQTEIGARFK